MIFNEEKYKVLSQCLKKSAQRPDEGELISCQFVKKKTEIFLSVSNVL